MTWRKGETGNPNGREKGSLFILQKQAQTLARKYGYDAFEKQILLSKKLENLVHRNHFENVTERLRHYELLQRIYRDTMPYMYPALKAIEITADMDAQEPDAATVEQQRDGLAFLLRQVRELADEQGVTEDGDARERGVA